MANKFLIKSVVEAEHFEYGSFAFASLHHQILGIGTVGTAYRTS